jgi:putative glutamine amidotransferase
MRVGLGGARPPLIGISAYSEVARWGLWDMPASLLPQTYADIVVAAGGIPVLLPPVPGIESAVSRLDGLIISGGPDIEPGRYGEPAGPHTTIVRPERDEAEIALFRAARAAGAPVLGICRGMQLMNVALGGALVQHLPDAVGHDGHSPTPGTMAEHKVTVGQPGSRSRLAAILGEGVRLVPTHHHQGIGRLGDGLVATAWADDGTVEAIELDGVFAIGVQWHPEAGDDPAVFRALVTAAVAATSS